MGEPFIEFSNNPFGDISIKFGKAIPEFYIYMSVFVKAFNFSRCFGIAMFIRFQCLAQG